jgi:2-C-methyl-D-erythritol 4-phosphate cytidylyltransferase
MRARAAAVVVAGGSGRRFGGPVRKQYLWVGGEPVLLRAIRPFLHHPRIGSVVVVLPPDDVAHPPPWLAELPVTIVAGGAERGDSVLNGLMAVGVDADRVLVHDGARPFVTPDVIDRVLDAEGGAIAAVPVTDTIQRVAADGVIVDTPDRATLWQAQTPQGFPRAALIEAYRQARAEGVAATDDAAVFARYAGPVRVVMGAHGNLKVTRPEDLPIAEAIAAGLPPSI